MEVLCEFQAISLRKPNSESPSACLCREAEADASGSLLAARGMEGEALEARLGSCGQAGPSYGADYLYSAPKLEARLGTAFVRSVPSVGALMQSLR